MQTGGTMKIPAISNTALALKIALIFRHFLKLSKKLRILMQGRHMRPYFSYAQSYDKKNY